jgi:hypothetical protein
MQLQHLFADVLARDAAGGYGIEDLLRADRVEIVEVLDGLQPGIGGRGATVCVAGEARMLSRGP